MHFDHLTQFHRCDLLLISTNKHDAQFNTLVFYLSTPENHEAMWERLE